MFLNTQIYFSHLVDLALGSWAVVLVYLNTQIYLSHIVDLALWSQAVIVMFRIRKQLIVE